MLIKKKCSLSIVSHGQFQLVKGLLDDLENFSDYILEIVVTLNIPEKIYITDYTNKIIVINNESIKGFGANHNQAFKRITGDYFFVLNPDIRIHSFDFDSFISKLESHNSGAVSPYVLNPNNEIEDHVREFPNLKNLVKRFVSKEVKNIYSFKSPSSILDNKWIAGMFMAFKSKQYNKLKGFDENFFLYLEDVDLCKRIIESGLSLSVDGSNKVIHYAQRTSHKSLKLFVIHCNSYLKYFIKWGL